jgi:hypothetical protein
MADLIHADLTAHMIGLLERPLTALAASPDPQNNGLAKRLLGLKFSHPQDGVEALLPLDFVQALAPTLMQIVRSPLRQSHPSFGDCAKAATRLLEFASYVPGAMPEPQTMVVIFEPLLKTLRPKLLELTHDRDNAVAAKAMMVLTETPQRAKIDNGTAWADAAIVVTLPQAFVGRLVPELERVANGQDAQCNPHPPSKETAARLINFAKS